MARTFFFWFSYIINEINIIKKESLFTTGRTGTEIYSIEQVIMGEDFDNQSRGIETVKNSCRNINQ